MFSVNTMDQISVVFHMLAVVFPLLFCFGCCGDCDYEETNYMFLLMAFSVFIVTMLEPTVNLELTVLVIIFHF